MRALIAGALCSLLGCMQNYDFTKDINIKNTPAEYLLVKDLQKGENCIPQDEGLVVCEDSYRLGDYILNIQLFSDREGPLLYYERKILTLTLRKKIGERWESLSLTDCGKGRLGSNCGGSLNGMVDRICLANSKEFCLLSDGSEDYRSLSQEEADRTLECLSSLAYFLRQDGDVYFPQKELERCIAPVEKEVFSDG